MSLVINRPGLSVTHPPSRQRTGDGRFDARVLMHKSGSPSRRVPVLAEGGVGGAQLNSRGSSACQLGGKQAHLPETLNPNPNPKLTS